MSQKTLEAFEHLHAAHKAAQLLHTELLGLLMTVGSPHDGWLDTVSDVEMIERQLCGALSAIENVLRQDPTELRRAVRPAVLSPAFSEA